MLFRSIYHIVILGYLKQCVMFDEIDIRLGNPCMDIISKKKTHQNLCLIIRKINEVVSP